MGFEADREIDYDSIIDEEASFHFMIMDLHHFIQKGLIQKIHTKLPVESKEILYKFYAGKC